MVANSALGILFFFNVHDGEANIVKAGRPFLFDRLVYVVGNAMKFLSSDNQIKMGYFAQKGRPAALRHAPQKTVDHRTITREGTQHAHFSESLLFGQVADTAGVE